MSDAPAGPAALSGARAKLERAREHFDELAREGSAFLNSGVYRIEERENPDEPGALQWVARVAAQPPARLAAIAGDVIHNARAALDLAVWDLVVINGGTPSSVTSFPIANSEKEFRARARQTTKGISVAASGVIERARPFKGGNDNLYRLHRLDIADKHRLLLTVGAASRSVGFKLPAFPPFPGETEAIEMPRIFLKPADRLFPLQDGAAVAGVSAQVRQEGGFEPPVIVFELAFGDEDTVRGEPVRETLEALIAEVERTVDALEEAAA